MTSWPLDFRLILASASPRRSDLLLEAGIPFEVEPARVAEVEDRFGDPESIVRENANLKATEVSNRFPGRVVVGADTVVALGDEVLGKPKDITEAFQMLTALAGKEHRVLTGVKLVSGTGTGETFVGTTKVRFRQLSDSEIRAYLKVVPVLDKAGSYALQDRGERIVESIEGSRSNVIGLPVEELVERLTRGGWSEEQGGAMPG
ncbi:MAG: Maf family protein [Verrucomicrobiota bacterium]